MDGEGPDADLIARLRREPLDGAEAEALIERYLGGQCMVLALAVHWMTGWQVEAVGQRGATIFSHFAAFDPGGLAWDIAGPRPRAEAQSGFEMSEPDWEKVDIHKFAFSGHAGVNEDDVSEACVAAIRMFGPRIEPYLIRTPKLPESMIPGAFITSSGSG